MENTLKMLSGDQQKACWYVATDNKNWMGPLSGVEVLEKIQKNELSWAHFAWREEQDVWKRLCLIPEFEAAVPQIPSKILQVEVIHEMLRAEEREARGERKARGGRSGGKSSGRNTKPSAKPSWFLYYNDTQFGPFDETEVHRFIQVGKVHGKVHAWRDGLENWVQLGKLEEFKAALQAKSAGSQAKEKETDADRRRAPRVPLLARSFVTAGDAMVVALCRDISVGGMQVLTEKMPGKVGSRLKLNVSPSGEGKQIEPFVAEGVIVRILEDGKGFSFRFEELTDNARKAIEHYIDAQ